MNDFITIFTAASAALAINYCVPFVHGFIPSNVPLTHPHHHNIISMHIEKSIVYAKIPGSENDDDDDDEDSEESIDGDITDPLMKELRYAKNEMFGKAIPINDELQQAAQKAENSFLSAMLEQTLQFKQIKQEEGSDRAVEAFMERIQEEQNPGGDIAEEEAGEGLREEEDSIAKKWFVQRIQEEQNPSVDTGDDEESDNAWQ